MVQVLIPLIVVTSMTIVFLRQQDPTRKLRVPWVTLVIFALTLILGFVALIAANRIDWRPMLDQPPVHTVPAPA